MSIQWAIPVWVWPLLLVAAAGAFVWTAVAYRQARPAAAPALRRLLTALRTAALLLLLAGVAGPALLRLQASTQAGRLLVVVEDSASMAIADGGPGGSAAADAATRWQRALGIAARLDSLLGRGDPPVDVIVLRGNGLEQMATLDPRDPAAEPPVRHGTDLDALLQQAAGRVADRPCGAVVLLTDGRQTAGLEAAGGPGAPAVPLFVIGMGDPRGPADRSIQDLRYPTSVHAGEEIQVDFALEQRGVPQAAHRSAEIVVEGQEGVLLRRTVELTGEATPVSLTLRPAREGLNLLRLSVEPLDDERFPANNQASLAVDVAKEKSRLLVLAWRPDWDVRFLAQAAGAERRLALSVVYPAAQGLVLADSLTPWPLPATPAAWRRWDGVVLQGWPSAGQAGGGGVGAAAGWTALAQAVQDGLGLLVVAPAEQIPGEAPSSPLAQMAQLLPVQSPNWRWRQGDFQPAAAAEAAGHPVLSHIDDGPAAAAGGVGSLAGLPPLQAVMPVRPQPDATVLLSARSSGLPAGTTADIPLLVVRGAGRGRTLWWGGRNLWELAFYEGPNVGEASAADHAGRRLLRNLLVWLAEGGEDSQMSFLGGVAAFQEGQPVRLRARWRDARGQPVQDRRALVSISPLDSAAGGTAQTFRLLPDPQPPYDLTAAIPPLAPGRYAASLVGEGEPPVQGPKMELAVVEHSVEDTQVQQDRRGLQQFADRHGGRYLCDSDPATPRRLAQDLAGLDWSGRARPLRTRRDLAGGWPYLGAIALLLAAEWWLRRRHGLL